MSQPSPQPRTPHAWDTATSADTAHFIWRHRGERTRTDWDEFFASGRPEMTQFLAQVAPYLQRRETALDFGCGLGRHLVHAATEFTRVIGVDASAKMLEGLREHCARLHVTNYQAYQVDEAWDEPASVDFVYSWKAFQHIEQRADLLRHLTRIGRCLRPDGVGYLQFDARERTLAYRLRNAIPDQCLHFYFKDWRRGLRRLRRPRRLLLAYLARAGLAVLDERQPGTDLQVFIVRPAERSG